MYLMIPDGESISIANADITVYKRIKRRWNCWIPPFYNKNESKFSYNKPITALNEDKNPIKHLTQINGYFFNHIDEGFHSSTIKNGSTNVVCIIPKGAEYCYGTGNEVVSTKLIVFRHIWNYRLYKLQHR